jgi:glutathione S-transferase
MNCGVRARPHEMPGALLADIARIDELWAEGLERFGGRFLAGDSFTAVDAMFAPVAFRVQTYDLEMSAASARYARLLLALPSMQAWYEEALIEPWRDPEHEEELRGIGTVTQDFRAPPPG